MESREEVRFFGVGDMSEEFNWKEFLKTDSNMTPFVEEGAIVDPRSGEMVVKPFDKPKLDMVNPNASQALADSVIEQPKFDIIADREVSGYAKSELKSVSDFHIDDVLRMAIEKKASDIHITVGLPPIIRLDGEIMPLPFHPLNPKDARRLVYDTLTNDQLERFETKHELDFGYSVKDLARFRFNVYMQRGSVAGALRVIPTKIPAFDTLGLPHVVREMSKRTSGLILVTGPTGSGKTTTIASMIDDLNENLAAHILTIEDPVEYIHRHKRCMVNQRELHHDTYSLHDALRAVLREDPDIILVGELRDLETIEAALTLAETGHLVFGTLHTRNAPASVDRIVDVFLRTNKIRFAFFSVTRLKESLPNNCFQRSVVDELLRSKSCSARQPSKTLSVKERLTRCIRLLKCRAPRECKRWTAPSPISTERESSHSMSA